MNTQATGAPLIDPIMERLEDQIGWYDRKSLLNQRNFKRIKIIEITAAALIPFVSAFNFQRMAWVSGGLGEGADGDGEPLAADGLGAREDAELEAGPMADW